MSGKSANLHGNLEMANECHLLLAPASSALLSASECLSSNGLFTLLHSPSKFHSELIPSLIESCINNYIGK